MSLRDGICRVCGEPTGLCQAGRTVLPPEGVIATSWLSPCPALGTVWWHVHLPGGRGPGWNAIHPLLCEAHSDQALYEHWIRGVPITHGEEVTPVKIKQAAGRAAVAALAVAAVLGLGTITAAASTAHSPPAVTHIQAQPDTYYHG